MKTIYRTVYIHTDVSYGLITFDHSVMTNYKFEGYQSRRYSHVSKYSIERLGNYIRRAQFVRSGLVGDLRNLCVAYYFQTDILDSVETPIVAQVSEVVR